MAINFNFDKYQTKTVNVAGREFNVAFNDEFREQLALLSLKLNAIQKTINTADTDDTLTLDDQKKVVKAAFKDLKDEAVTFFNVFFGDGAGDWIYKKANQSTTALYTLVKFLETEADKQTTSRSQRRRGNA